MLLFNKKLKQQIKKLQIILDNSEKSDDVLLNLNNFYEKISNRKDTKYNTLYKLDKIFFAPTLKEMVKEYSTVDATVLELVKYKQAPNDLIIIFNKFINRTPTQVEMFIEKGE